MYELSKTHFVAEWADHVVIVYSTEGLQFLYGKRFKHVGCSLAKEGANETTWYSYDPIWVSSQHQCIKDAFHFHFTPYGVALDSGLANQIAAIGPHLNISAYHDILKQTAQDN